MFFLNLLCFFSGVYHYSFLKSFLSFLWAFFFKRCFLSFLRTFFFKRCFLCFLRTFFTLNWFTISTQEIIESTRSFNFFISRTFRTFFLSGFLYLSFWRFFNFSFLFFLFFFLLFFRFCFHWRLFIYKAVINMIKIFRTHAFSVLTSGHIFRMRNFRWSFIWFLFNSIDMHHLGALFILWFLLVRPLSSFFSFTSTTSFLLFLTNFSFAHFNLRTTFLEELCWLWIIDTFDFFYLRFVLLRNLWINWGRWNH